MINGIVSDLRSSLRSLRQSPSFTIFAGLCLALGIGAACSVFTVVDAFLLRPLPFEAPGRLGSIWMTVESSDLRYFVAPPSFNELEEQASLFEAAGAQPADFNLAGSDGEIRRAGGAYVTANFFRVLGVRPLAGRFFSDQDEQREAAVCLLSEELWRSEWGAEEKAMGRALRINGAEYEVAGIVPAKRGFPDGVEVWIPMTRKIREGRRGILAIGRLKPDASFAQARQELRAIAERLREMDPVANRTRGLDVQPISESLSRDLRATLYAVFAAVGFLLAIACANVACLILARIRRQTPEIALRSALGASRGRILRRLLVENGLLTVFAAMAGTGIAYAAVPVVMAISPTNLPDFKTIGVDARVVAFAAALALATLLLSASAPVFSAASKSAADFLREMDRSSSGGMRRQHKMLLVLDGALALLLVAGAGLMARNFALLQSTSPGFDPGNLVQMRITASEAFARTHDSRVDFMARAEERLQALPAVEKAGSTHSNPFGDFQFWINFLLRDQPPEQEGQGELAMFQIVTPSFFETLGLPILEGRGLEPSDNRDSLRVAVVSRSLAERYWPGGSAIGKQLRPVRTPSKDAWWTVVGVAADLRDRGLGEPEGPSLYFPQRQFVRGYTSSMSVLLRIREGAGADIGASARQAIRSVDPQAVVFEMRPMGEILGDSLARQRFSAVLSSAFAALALLLAAAGIYGVVSYGVVRRRLEMGIRLAFGARGGDLRRMVVKDAMSPLSLGLALGFAASLFLSGWLGEQLQAAQPRDPLILALAALGLAGVSLLASYLPARRSSRLDPMQALRGE